MLLLKIGTDNFVPWTGQEINGIKHPLSIESRWTTQELLDIGLYTIAPADPIPEGKVVTGKTYVEDNWTAKTVYTLADKEYTTNEVLQERDRRISQNFIWNGNEIQARPDDRENIIGASLSATLAIMNGAQPGNTKWAGGNVDFTWIVANNSTIALDAFQMVDMGQTAMATKKFLIYKAKEIKEIIESGNNTIDIANNTYWAP